MSSSKSNKMNRCDARMHYHCLSNWKRAIYLGVAASCLALGIFITVQTLYLGRWGQLWILGPILVMTAIFVAMMTCLMRQRAIEVELESQKCVSDMEYEIQCTGEEPPEKQAVLMEPIYSFIIL